MTVTSPPWDLLKPQRGVRTRREHAKGHQGAPGSSSWPSPAGRLRGGLCSKPWVLQDPHRKCVKREVCFAANVPGCSKDRTYQPVLKTCAGPGQPLSPRGLSLEKSGQKIRAAKKLYLQEQMISLEPVDLHFISASTSVFTVPYRLRALNGYSESQNDHYHLPLGDPGGVRAA